MVLFGSDWACEERLADPINFTDELSASSTQEVDRIMCINCTELIRA